MRNGCLPNLGNIYRLWRRKSKKVDRAAWEAKEVSKLMTEECWIRGDVECKSHVHDSSTSIKNGSLRRKEVAHGKARDKFEYKSIKHDSRAANKNRILHENEVITAEAREMADEKLEVIIDLDESLGTEKDEEANDKLLGERGILEKVDVIRTEAEQVSTHDQAKPRPEYRRVPKFGDWNDDQPFTVVFDSARHAKRGALNDEFNKVKTFDLRGIKSNGNGLK